MHSIRDQRLEDPAVKTWPKPQKLVKSFQWIQHCQECLRISRSLKHNKKGKLEIVGVFLKEKRLCSMALIVGEHLASQM